MGLCISKQHRFTRKATDRRFVDTFKRTVKKIQAGGEGLDEALDIFLTCYRSTPCRSAPGGKSPAEILIGRPLRTSLELLRPPSKFTKATNNKQDNKRYNDVNQTPGEVEPSIPLDILLGAWGLNQPEDSLAASVEPPPGEPEGFDQMQREFLRELFEPASQPRRARMPTRATDLDEALPRRSSRQRHTPVRYEPYQLY